VTAGLSAKQPPRKIETLVSNLVMPIESNLFSTVLSIAIWFVLKVLAIFRTVLLTVAVMTSANSKPNVRWIVKLNLVRNLNQDLKTPLLSEKAKKELKKDTKDPLAKTNGPPSTT